MNNEAENKQIIKSLDMIIIEADDADAWNGLDDKAVAEKLQSIIKIAEKARKRIQDE